MKKKNKIIVTAIFIVLVLVIVVGCIILFAEKEKKSLEIKGDIAKISLRVGLGHGDNICEYTDSEDIEKIMNYLSGIQYREETVYERIKRGRHVGVLSTKQCDIIISAEDKSILARIIFDNYGHIAIDDKSYKLVDEELNPYEYLGNFIEEKESESVSQ